MKYALWVILAVAGCELEAADYYVGGSGADSNSGTSQANAWRSIARANAQKFAPGDRLLFEGGQVFAGTLEISAEDSGSPGKPLIVASWGSGTAELDGGDRDGILAENAAHVEVRQLEIRGSGARSNRGSGILFRNTLPEGIRLEGIRIAGVIVHGFWYAGILIEAQPPDKSASGYRGVEISDSEAYDNVYYGIYVSGENTGRQGYAHQNIRVADCKAHDNPGDPAFKSNHSGNGILFDDVDTGVIEHSIAYGNGALNGGETGGPVGIWAHSSNKIVIQFCESYANRTGGAADGGGFDFDGGVTNSMLQYNYSHDNDGAGYLVWNYQDAPHELRGNIIRYNVSENDGRKQAYGGIHIGTADKPVRDLLAYNNSVFVAPAAKGHPSGIWIGGKQNEAIRIFNNLVVALGSDPLVDLGDGQEAEFGGNAFWSTTKAPVFRGDAARIKTASISLDPQLDDRHCPRAGSPLIGEGVELRKLGIDPGAHDICGRPAQPAIIGACAYSAAATCTPQPPAH
jgi:hypothetical protein